MYSLGCALHSFCFLLTQVGFHSPSCCIQHLTFCTYVAESFLQLPPTGHQSSSHTHSLATKHEKEKRLQPNCSALQHSSRNHSTDAWERVELCLFRRSTPTLRWVRSRSFSLQPKQTGRWLFYYRSASHRTSFDSPRSNCLDVNILQLFFIYFFFN